MKEEIDKDQDIFDSAIPDKKDRSRILTILTDSILEANNVFIRRNKVCSGVCFFFILITLEACTCKWCAVYQNKGLHLESFKMVISFLGKENNSFFT